MSIVSNIKQILTKSSRERNGVYIGSDNDEFIPPRKLERWRKHEFKYPSEHPTEGHTKVWTGAPGVWHCRTCGEWYRIWEGKPRYAKEQRGYSET